MITAMVAGYYELNGNEAYPPGLDAYGGDFCYGVQDMCNHMPCNFHGHPGMRMVQNNGTGPVPLQLPVPSGHLVQQVVDENGTVRHFLLSPPMMPVGPHYSPNHGSSAAMATQYYPYATPTYGPPPFQTQPPSHLQSALSPPSIPGILPHPGSQCNGESPQDVDASPPPSQAYLSPKEESYQRSTFKFRRKLESRGRDKLLMPPNQSNSFIGKRDRKFYKYDDPYRFSGSSASGSNASEDEEVTWILSEYLCNLRPPMVTELSPYSVMVSWKPPDVPISDLEPALLSTIEQSEIMYEVMLCEKGKEGRFKSVYSGMDHHCSITSLKPATEYYVCVQASVDDIRGNSAKGLTFKTQRVEPEAPQPPKLCARTKNSLTLKWSSNCDSSPGSRITYILEYDEGYSRNSFSSVYTGPLKQYKVTKLCPATAYRFRLAAMNDKGKSAYSETCCYFTSGNLPSQPSPPVLKHAFINQLHLEWERRTVEEDFSLEIEDKRHVFRRAYSGRDNQFVCSGLTGNTEYRFRLMAINEEGSSPWSRTATFCTLPDKLSCPGKPVPKGRIHASCFRVTWDPPKDCRNSSITKYILEMDRGLGFDHAYTGPENEFFIENLLPGTTYRLRVAALVMAAGHSPFSEVNSITTAAVSPGKCALPKLQSKPEASFVCLDWAHPEHDGGAVVCEYEVDMTSPDNVTLQVYKGPETSCIVNDLLPGRPYLFQVRAYNRVGSGPFSDPLEVVSGAGSPDPPRSMTASAESPSACSLSWVEPLNNGAAITGYQLLGSTEEDEESFTELYEGLSFAYVANGLQPATLYYFKVRASNEAGSGPFSETVTVKTPASAPGVISGFRSEAFSTAISLSWVEPPSNGSDVLSYNVTLDDVLYNTEESVPELYIEDLTPETSYMVRIQAINGEGLGPFSEPVPVTTLRSPPSPPDLECVGVGHNFLKLKWGTTNPDNHYYTVEMSGKTKSFVPVYHGPGMSCRAYRLQENAPVNFRICASSESGQGPYSPLYTFRTARAPPPVLKAPKVVSVSNDSCLVEWSGAKQLSGSISYQLQLSSGKADAITVYQGSDTKCCLDELEPDTPYAVRIAAIRHCEQGEMVGNFGPYVSFTTCCKETRKPVQTSTAHAPPHTDRRTLTDRHYALGLVLMFQVISIFLAMFLEHFFSLSAPS